MSAQVPWASTFEFYVLRLVDTYERHFANKLGTMEKLATGAIRNRLWFYTLKVAVDLLPERFGDSYEKYFFASSRRDSIGANVTDDAWKTHWVLQGIQGLNPRDLRVAAIQGFVAKDGTVDILMPLVRFFAILAVVQISAIALVYVGFVIALWSPFTLETHPVVIAFLILFYPTLSAIMAIACVTLSYIVFVSGVLPLSTAYKFKSKERDFLRNGILYQIHE